MQQMYKQCKLKRNNSYKYAWLPAQYARVGKILKICDEDGWVVKEVFSSASESSVKAYERGYKKWRKVTDK